MKGKARRWRLPVGHSRRGRTGCESRFNTVIEPGLSREDFFQRLGGDPLPPLKDLVMSESDFKKKYIVPINRNIADKTLENIKNEEAFLRQQAGTGGTGQGLYPRTLYSGDRALSLDHDRGDNDRQIHDRACDRCHKERAAVQGADAAPAEHYQAVLLGGVSGVGIGAALQMAELLYINQGVSKILSSGARQIAHHTPGCSTGSCMCSRSFTGRARLCRISRI